MNSLTPAQKARRLARIEKNLTAAIADMDALIELCAGTSSSHPEARTLWGILARQADHTGVVLRTVQDLKGDAR